MAKQTVLEIVQDILNDTSGEFVNSIDDTDEAQQVAAIVASTYRAMISNRNWPHTLRTITLTPSGDNDFPTYMTIEDNLKELVSVFYDKADVDDTQLLYREIKWREPDEFLRLTFGRNSANANVQTIIDPTGVKLLIQNDKAPDYYTSFDDNTLVFDSFDSAVESTLQASKTLARGYVIPAFTLSDTHVPDLPEEAFPALVEEAKSRASLKLNETPDAKSEQEAGRQQRWLSRKAWRVKGGVKYPNYGRKRRRASFNEPTFREDN